MPQPSHRTGVGTLAFLAALLALSACGDSPSAPMDEEALMAQAEADAVAAAEAGWSSLPSLRTLVSRTRQAVTASGGNDQVRRLFRRAHVLADSARVAFDEGDLEAARALMARAERTLIRAVVEGMGPEIARASTDAAEAVLDRVIQAVGDRPLPVTARRRIRRAEAFLAQARAALDQGRASPALHFALEAADEIRFLMPPRMAREALKQASDLFRAASTAAGNDPEEAVRHALRRARNLIADAKNELEAGNWAGSTEASRDASMLCMRVLNHLSG